MGLETNRLTHNSEFRLGEFGQQAYLLSSMSRLCCDCNRTGLEEYNSRSSCVNEGMFRLLIVLLCAPSNEVGTGSNVGTKAETELADSL